jgi:hypothetical protein
MFSTGYYQYELIVYKLWDPRRLTILRASTACYEDSFTFLCVMYGQSPWSQIQRSRVRFPTLPDFLASTGSGTGSTQPREYTRGVNGVICVAEK